MVKLAVASLGAVVVDGTAEPEKMVLSGEALGWYINALRAQVPIRAIAGAVCRVVAGSGGWAPAYAFFGELAHDLHPHPSSGQKRFASAEPMMYPIRL